MDPSSKPASGIELPMPAGEPLSLPADPGETAPGGLGPEKLPANAERGTVPGPPSMVVPTTIPLPQPLAVPSPDPVTAGTVTNSTAPVKVEDDGDLIEKAWVDKAKQIVERTKDDPHKQSEAMTVFRADYMKKRYGKTIKLSQ